MIISIEALIAIVGLSICTGWFGTMAYLTVSCDLYLKRAMKEIEQMDTPRPYKLLTQK